MAELTEETVKGFTESITKLVTLVESRVPEAPAAPEVKDAAEDRKAAVEATRIVESAELPKEFKDKLIESINGGNYEVQAEVDAYKTLRESIKTEVETTFREAGHVIGAAGSAGAGTAPVTVSAWSTE